jgi:hypothetical protein
MVKILSSKQMSLMSEGKVVFKSDTMDQPSLLPRNPEESILEGICSASYPGNPAGRKSGKK